MTWFLLAVVIVCLVAIGVLAVTLSRAREEHERARRRLAGAEQRARNAEERAGTAEREATEAAAAGERDRQRAKEAEDRAVQAEGRLALARQQARPEAGGESAGLETLWSLALLEQERAWRLTMASPAGAPVPARDLGLAGVLEAEIARIREEAGTPGRLHTELAEDPAPADAVVALRAIEGVLAALSRYSDAYDLYLSGSAGDLRARLVCERFDGPDAAADDASAVYRALAPVGGSLEIGRDDQDRLEVHLSLPRRGAHE